MAEESKLDYPQVTPEQIELWLNNSVTKVYFQCLGWKRKDIRNQAGEGQFIDSSNADLTHAMAHVSMGQRDGVQMAMDHESLFSEFNMILLPKEDK